MSNAYFRFYAELNDFLPPGQCQTPFLHIFNGRASIKDRIESLGVPHTEVDLILANGRPVDFDYLVRNDDRFSVYPRFRSLDTSGLHPLRPPTPNAIRFVLDAHLGKLANYLRMLGFDTLYRNDYDDDELARIAAEEVRVLVTRDRGLLKRKEVTYGCFIRSLEPRRQLGQILHRYDLFDQITPFHRCLSCNGSLEPVAKEAVRTQLLPKTRRYYDEFYRCRQCGQIYWKGSHYERMQRFVQRLLHNER